MTKPNIPVVTIFDVGSRKCSMAVEESDGVRLRIFWKPGKPERLTEAELEDFRRGRDRFVDEVVRTLGVDREAIQHFGEI